MATVSVIMPAYNVAPYLPSAIDSVLAQTYRDFELVVVNDGSTDDTLAIAESYQARHPDRVRVVSQNNRGLAAARNSGLRASTGAVFALLDSDDAWMPAYLAEQMRVLDGRPDVAIVTGNAFDRGGPQDGQPARPMPDDRPAPHLVEILLDEYAVFIMSVFRREVVDCIGGFDESFRTNEDYDFWIRAALAGFVFARNPTPLAYYTRRSDSLSANDTRMLAGILRVFRKNLSACAEGTPARSVIVRQIARFEGELMAAEARDALARDDASTAAARLDALRLRRGRGVHLSLAARTLRAAPRVALWAYRLRRRFQSMPRRSSGARIVPRPRSIVSDQSRVAPLESRTLVPQPAPAAHVVRRPSRADFVRPDKPTFKRY
ncbi:MAG TPA: glycosyltransferase family A protein [Vicinamibacterales bacterium]|jgi:glycosyltransferase involved in cell wall biosynthesis|nr:glycosyltransferase family A protein [Vicinamibacterales bacterium]